MKYLLLSSVILLTACGSIQPLKGAPEVHTAFPNENAKVTTFPDGSRYVVISDGQQVHTTIILPPLKEQSVETPKEPK